MSQHAAKVQPSPEGGFVKVVDAAAIHFHMIIIGEVPTWTSESIP